VESRLDARDAHLTRRRRRPELALADLAQACEQIGLDGGELLVRDLAELQAHLRGQQLLAQDAVVVELAVDGSGNLAQHELQAAHQERVDDDHDVDAPRRATPAMTDARWSGATGLETCVVKPASSARARSSTRG